MSGKIILTDIDETVLQFCAPFQAFAEAECIPTHGVLREIYDLDTFLRCDRETAEAILEAFVVHDGINQPAEPCAKAVLPLLYDEGYRFTGISACGNDPDFRVNRLANLDKEFGFAFDELLTVALQGSKRDILSQFAPAIWVEDHFDHAVTGAELGHRVFLMDKPYNRGREHPDVTRVAGWNEIYEALSA